ncbi:hypothetical protein [Methyloferula stellata]|uniref:hypothetical protein n=1 Tax=Methyloferula stellata TaxID=876270 RepID=UPI000377FCE8|nr:hypothetical protein [Methyloferula stellata]
MPLPDGRASRFSQIYIDRGGALRDDARMRQRLSASLPERGIDNLAKELHSELGIVVRFGPYGVYWNDFYEEAELRDVLDSVTLIFNILNRDHLFERRAKDYLKTVSRIFAEQNVGYKVDDLGVVHFVVDEEFERGRNTCIAALHLPRYVAVAANLDKAFSVLDTTPPDGKSSVRSVFDALEGLFRLMFTNAHRLGGSEIDQYLRPAIARTYMPGSADLRAAGKFLDSMKDWVETAHFYRHEQGKEEPAQPPLDIAVALISTGTGFLRWLAELDQRGSPNT